MARPDGSILVTRPGKDGESLTQLLREQGLSAFHQPLITLDAATDMARRAKQWAALPANSVVIFVSQPAVTYSHQLVQGHWREDLHYFAVGAKTQSLAQALGIRQIQAPKQQDSEGLLELITTTLNVEGRQFLICRGNGGRDALRQALLRSGAQADYCEVYQRRLLPLDANNLYDQWRKWQIAGIVVSSGDHFQKLKSLMAGEKLAWLLEREFIVFSQRIGNIIEQSGGKHIKVCEQPSNEAVIRCLTANAEK